MHHHFGDVSQPIYQIEKVTNRFNKRCSRWFHCLVLNRCFVSTARPSQTLCLSMKPCKHPRNTVTKNIQWGSLSINSAQTSVATNNIEITTSCFFVLVAFNCQAFIEYYPKTFYWRFPLFPTSLSNHSLSIPIDSLTVCLAHFRLHLPPRWGNDFTAHPSTATFLYPVDDISNEPYDCVNRNIASF